MTQLFNPSDASTRVMGLVPPLDLGDLSAPP